MGGSVSNRARTALEDLQHDLVEIDAFAHAAQALLDCLPFVPWPVGEGQDLEARLNLDRLPALVGAVCVAARRARLACHQRLALLDVEELPK